jgi:ATP-dependent RNA helicase RhlE
LTIQDTTATGGFAALGISGQLLKATEAAGFTEPKPIQLKAIPPQLEGKDILGIAQTGSGKTAAFSLPMLARIAGLGDRRRPRTARALVLAPTRELAVQIEETVRLLSRGMHISTALILGGVSRNSQVKRLQPGVDILVATPGRLMDLVREGDVILAETQWLVLDEADRMLDMGFINDVRKIASPSAHAKRQTALFSRRPCPKDIAELAPHRCCAIRSRVAVDAGRLPPWPAHHAEGHAGRSFKQKPARSWRRCSRPSRSDRALMIFARTKHGADKVVKRPR